MPKRFKRSDLRSNLSRFIGHEAVADEVLSSHAFGKVARENGPTKTPGSRRVALHNRQHVARYRDSMLAHSATHFRVTVPERPKEAPGAKDATRSGKAASGHSKRDASGSGKASADDARQRHHFTEPPKRGFNRFG